MNRSDYFNFIERELSILATRISVRGGLNILDLNIHSENFYLNFFNLLFDWHLTNINSAEQNAAAVDLVDKVNNIIIQVSATATKQKIESALNKKDIAHYSGYSFKFIAISKEAKALQTKVFANPYKLTFSPESDIYDISSILNIIVGLEIDKQKSIYDFLKRELKSGPDPEKIDSNLATIIKILAKENWNQELSGFERVPYDIEEKVIYNQLDTASIIIDDHKVHYNRIDKIYSDFDKQGMNKSISILNGIRSEYIKLILEPNASSDQIFLLVIEQVIKKIRGSANYTPMADEELELSVQILVVDTFIRCKIFKNPSGTAHADP